MQKATFLLLPYLALTLFFFYANPNIDRGEYGSFAYTITKCAPILYLSAAAFLFFEKAHMKELEFLEKFLGKRHPAAVTFLLSALGDYFLANRSRSLNDFCKGVVPFGVAHFLNTKFHRRGRQNFYWKTAGLLLAVYAVVVAVVTFDKVQKNTHVVFQVFTFVYALVLAWSVWCAVSDWHLHGAQNLKYAIRAAGYVIFMISDSTLTLDEFYKPVKWSQGYVLITYYAAQALIFYSFALETRIVNTKMVKKQ